jgi:hypothetical protein
MSSLLDEMEHEVEREFSGAGFYKLKELSCKVVDDGKMEATGTEVLLMFNGTLRHSNGTLRETDDKLESVTVGTPDQFTGTAVHMDHGKPQENVVTTSNLAAKAEKGGNLPADVFYSSIGKEQLKKCFTAPSV